MRGNPPSAAEVAEIVAVAQEAGAHDEAARAVINYLWSAWAYDPLDRVESTVEQLTSGLQGGIGSESYAEYMRFSLAALVYVPAGRWEDAGRMLRPPAAHASASSRLVWLWLACGQAFRLGDLEAVDALLPELRDTALATEEPQRILPMASVAMPRALLAGELDDVRRLGRLVATIPDMTVSASSFAIARTLAACGEADLLRAVHERWGGRESGTLHRTALAVQEALLVRLDGRPEAAAERLSAAESTLVALGRPYDGACVALETAAAFEAAGHAADAEGARTRARRVLEPLGCVNPW
jgi:hypothetical protein